MHVIYENCTVSYIVRYLTMHLPSWILPLCPVILYVVLDYDGYCQVLQVMTRDLLSLVSKP